MLSVEESVFPLKQLTVHLALQRVGVEAERLAHCVEADHAVERSKEKFAIKFVILGTIFAAFHQCSVFTGNQCL
jgi:hypothetical protein